MLVTVQSQNRFANLQIIGMTKKKKIVLPPVRVNSFPIDVSYVKGDKIIIHKCDIDKAIKTIKACADPYGDAEREAGRIDILEDLLDIIERGKRLQYDLEIRMEHNRWMKEIKERDKNL